MVIEFNGVNCGTYVLTAVFFPFSSTFASSFIFVSFVSGFISFFLSCTARVDFFGTGAGGGARPPVRCVIVSKCGTIF